ncbi:MAG: hypothetical protein Q4E91_09750, partial [Lachnospiraceae bacterium]|nr:hypothetical protein [Lachnospiraceae bacterium]
MRKKVISLILAAALALQGSAAAWAGEVFSLEGPEPGRQEWAAEETLIEEEADNEDAVPVTEDDPEAESGAGAEDAPETESG